MKPIRLYRLGSDPEFAFTRLKEWDHLIVPADQVISKNKALALQSFIGTDAHAATAELRPPPSHNVRSQILTVASALGSVEEYLKGQDAYRDVRVIASPSVCNEPLGGHIHLSFFFEDKDYKKLLDHGWNYTTALVGASWNAAGGGGVPFTGDSDVVAAVKTKTLKLQLPTPTAVTHVLNYLLLPLEWWLQIWGSRLKRNAKYGLTADTQVRWNASPAPNMPEFKNHCYLHYEYRAPSTWLCHPWMMYLYFAIAKLIAVNWQVVTEAMGTNTKNLTLEVHNFHGSEPRNEEARALFEKRYLALKPHLRWTNDTKDIDKALDYATKYRNQWVDPYRGVMLDAWKEVLA